MTLCHTIWISFFKCCNSEGFNFFIGGAVFRLFFHSFDFATKRAVEGSELF